MFFNILHFWSQKTFTTSMYTQIKFSWTDNGKWSINYSFWNLSLILILNLKSFVNTGLSPTVLSYYVELCYWYEPKHILNTCLFNTKYRQIEPGEYRRRLHASKNTNNMFYIVKLNNFRYLKHSHKLDQRVLQSLT